MSQTNTREGDVGETSSKKKKTRRGSHEMFEFLEKKCERTPNETRRDKVTKGGVRSNDCNDETATTATSEFAGYVSKPANSANTSYVGNPRKSC